MLEKTLDGAPIANPEARRSWRAEARRQGRLLGIRALNFILHRRSVLLVIGYLNQRHPFLSTVFVAYLATDEYSREYVAGARRKQIRWSPWLVGVYVQGGKLGLMFVISATEAAVLNEVYPEPDADTLAILDAVGCPVFHVVGMKARSWPAFPRAYRGGIPCCAGRLEAISEPLIARLG